MAELHSRTFSNEEQVFLERVAEKLQSGAGDRLRQDVKTARIMPDGDYLLVDLPGYQRPEYQGHRNLPFEGKMYAADGGAMTVLVNMDRNDRLLSVEFIRWESAGSVDPDWSTLTIVAEPPMGVSDW